jgi:hypothetical protein
MVGYTQFDEAVKAKPDARSTLRRIALAIAAG